MNAKLMLITDQGVQEFVPKALLDAITQRAQNESLNDGKTKLHSDGEKVIKKLYTMAQISDLFETSRPTIYAWIKKQILKPIHIGGRVYFKPSDIDRLIEERISS